jgi:hypothetical protein
LQAAITTTERAWAEQTASRLRCDLHRRPCDAHFPSIPSMSLKTKVQAGVRTYGWRCILHGHACRQGAQEER